MSARIDATFARLRFGSSGEAVKALQAKLGVAVDGAMGSGTTMKWIARQKASDAGAADGIVTPPDAQELGIVL